MGGGKRGVGKSSGGLRGKTVSELEGRWDAFSGVILCRRLPRGSGGTPSLRMVTVKESAVVTD